MRALLCFHLNRDLLLAEVFVPQFKPVKPPWKAIYLKSAIRRRDRVEWVIVNPQKGLHPAMDELLSKVVDGASGGDLILPDSVDEFHIFNDLSQAAVAL